MKRRMSIILLVSAVTACLLLMGTAQAIYDQTGIIDSQFVIRTANQDPPFVTELRANITLWLHVRILPMHTYMWEWITFDPALVTCNVSGTVFIQFPTYITIESWTLSLPYAPWNYSGGSGYYWVMIAMFGNNFGPLTITTNYIDSSYWGTSIPINITLTAGTGVNSTTIWLNI